MIARAASTESEISSFEMKAKTKDNPNEIKVQRKMFKMCFWKTTQQTDQFQDKVLGILKKDNFKVKTIKEEDCDKSYLSHNKSAIGQGKA